MAFKFVAFAGLLAVAQAGVISSPLAYSAPIAHAPLAYSAPIAKVAAPLAYSSPLAYSAPIAKVAKTVVSEEYDPNPQYSYGYSINDALTGDSKDQHETRNGDAVQGSYSLIDADGFKRTVEYTADPIHGFNAVVHREPLGVKTITKVAAPVAYAAPITKVAAPVAYSAYAAPVAKVAAYSAPAYYHH